MTDRKTQPPAERAGRPETPRDQFIRLADVKPQSYDAKARTFEVVWGTDAPVRRYDWWDDEYFDEVLSFDPAHVDMSRLQSGAAPLLDTHGTYALEDVIGVVERASLDGGKGMATVRLADVPSTSEIAAKVEQGILRNISVGYRVRKWMTTPPGSAGGVPTRTAIDWQPFEVSLVPVPADPSAGVRGNAPEMIEGAQHRKDETMPTEAEKAAALAAEETRKATENATRAAELEAATKRAKEEAAKEERQRLADIDTAARAIGLDAQDEFVRKLRDDGVGIDEARRMVLEKAAERSKAQATQRGFASVGASGDDPNAIREAMAESIALRALNKKPEADSRAREYMDFRMLDFLRETTGAKTRSNVTLVDDYLSGRLQRDGGGMHSSSDFPLLLEAAANKILLPMYQLATPTYQQVFRRRDFNDFKTHKALRMGDLPMPKPLGEGGEIKYGTFGENRETGVLATNAIALAVTRQMLVNDDLGAFNDLVGPWGQVVAAWENQTAWALVTANPTLSDTVAVFHATHGNVGTAGAITVDSLSEARKKMSSQKTLGGLYTNVAGRYLITGVAYQTAAEQILRTITPTQASNVNPFSGTLIPIADANIPGNAWYVAADPALIPNFQYGYLADRPGPQFRVDRPFDRDGVSMALLIDFGVYAVDFRGWVKNAGA